MDPYHEPSSSGDLRYVQFTTAGSGAEEDGDGEAYDEAASVQIGLVWNADEADLKRFLKLQRFAQAIWKLNQSGNARAHARVDGSGGAGPHVAGLALNAKPAPPPINSVWLNVNTSKTNTIFGPRWRLLHGERNLWHRLGGADIIFGVGSFVQVRQAAGTIMLLVRGLLRDVIRLNTVCVLIPGEPRCHGHVSPSHAAVCAPTLDRR